MYMRQSSARNCIQLQQLWPAWLQAMECSATSLSSMCSLITVHLLRCQAALLPAAHQPSCALSICCTACAAAFALSTAFSTPAPVQKSPQAASLAWSALRQGVPRGWAG